MLRIAASKAGGGKYSGMDPRLKREMRTASSVHVPVLSDWSFFSTEEKLPQVKIAASGARFAHLLLEKR